jgi:hypothetical protein
MFDLKGGKLLKPASFFYCGLVNVITCNTLVLYEYYLCCNYDLISFFFEIIVGLLTLVYSNASYKILEY